MHSARERASLKRVLKHAHTRGLWIPLAVNMNKVSLFLALSLSLSLSLPPSLAPSHVTIRGMNARCLLGIFLSASRRFYSAP